MYLGRLPFHLDHPSRELPLQMDYHFKVDCHGAVDIVRDSHTADLSSFPCDWLLHHGDNRGRHSANHNLLPDMYLRVPILGVTMCHDNRLILDVIEVTDKL